MGSENTGALCDAQHRTLSYRSYGNVQNPRIGDIVLNSNPDTSNPEGKCARWICMNENGVTPKEK
jgi:hypothetical protein